jgi:hypothetical protein
LGGAGNSREKTIKRGQEEKVLQHGSKLIFTERQNPASGASRNAHHIDEPEDYSILNFGDGEEDIPAVVDDNNDVLKMFPGRRSSDSDDYQYAQNWRKAEERIVEILFSGDITPCSCKRPSRTVKLVRVDLKEYRVRSYMHCFCGMSAALLVKKSFFPASPIHPRTPMGYKYRIMYDRHIWAMARSYVTVGGTAVARHAF